MSKLCITIPPIAPDYSGAASALFDLGGIVVMHDASGCTGNYTGFDEPRWLGSRSAIYCSGLRRMDAVMGNDQKFIDGALAAAKDLDPTMIAYLGSPVPMVIGIDLEGMAMETENASGIPSFGFNTTGQHYYDKGASDVFVKLIKRFAKMPKKADVSRTAETANTANTTKKKRANVLGLLSVDMGNETNPEDIRKHIENAGYEINASFAMGLSLEQIERVAEAGINIVTARCGLDAAQYMEKKYGIPYICCVPVGDGEIFRQKLQGQRTADCMQEEHIQKSSDIEMKNILIIHEQVLANSLRETMEDRSDVSVTVGSMYHLDSRIAREHDLDLPHELSVKQAVNSGDYSVVIADPEIKKLVKREDVTFIDLPHVAISGRLYLDTYPLYLSEKMEDLIHRAISAVAKG